MKYIDTHKAYEKLIASGLNDEQAKLHLVGYETIGLALWEWLKDAKEDFASQKTINIMGGLIFAALLAIGGQIWYLTHKVSEMDIRLINLEKRFE